MGAVYRAEHTLLGRPAAVKVLLPELSQNQDMVTRFFNEARAATTIRNPGIVEVYDFGWSADGSAYLVMELLDGESLATRMGRGRMPYATAIGVVRQIAGALGAAHAKGIVHRDLKPDNVFLVPDPEVRGGERAKLLDFGIAKLAGDRAMGQMTRTGAVMGTPTYMAPEQCRGVAVDHRADLYALGCICFELCAGRPPFVGEGVGDVLAAHIHVAPPAVAALAPDVPHALAVVIQRLLVKDPAQRLGSAEELVHALDRIAGDDAYRSGPPRVAGPVVPTSPAISAGISTVAWSTPTGAPRAMAPGSRRGRGIAIAAAAVLTIGVVIAVMARGGDGAAASVPAAAGAIDAGAAAIEVAPAIGAATVIDAAPAIGAAPMIEVAPAIEAAPVIDPATATEPPTTAPPRATDPPVTAPKRATDPPVTAPKRKRARPPRPPTDRDSGSNPF